MAAKCEIPNAGMINRQNPGPCPRKARAVIIFKGTEKKVCNQCKPMGTFVRKL